MIAQHRGECTECDKGIRVGEPIEHDGEGWAHVTCPPPRVVFVCQTCFMVCPCPCEDDQ